MSLKPQNIIQAAEADLVRVEINEGRGSYRDAYEHYAFHRAHARRAKCARDMILLALMDYSVRRDDPEKPHLIGTVKTVKRNTKHIYGNGELLVEALRRLDG